MKNTQQALRTAKTAQHHSKIKIH